MRHQIHNLVAANLFTTLLVLLVVIVTFVLFATQGIKVK